MGKRTILAILLSWVVLLGWSLLAPKTQPLVNKDVSKEQATLSVAQSPDVKSKTEQITINAPESALFKYAQPKYEIHFLEKQAAAQTVIFKDYQSSAFNLKYAFLLGDGSLKFRMDKHGENKLNFIYSDQDKRILKEFTFDKSNYTIELRIIFKNYTTHDLSLNLPFVLGAFEPTPARANYQGITIAKDDKILHLGLSKSNKFSAVKFCALRDRYFCVIAQPESSDTEVFINKVTPKLTEVGFIFDIPKIPAQGEIEKKIRLYLGPQDLTMINKADPKWTAIINYGSFDFISRLILQSLEALYKLVHNWGLVIIILSVAIYLLLYPLTLKQMRSVRAMQALQPKIEELRKTYKDNPQKLNKEILELYKINKVNPMGGCLPLLLQIPIFLALYQVLTRSIALKGAHFLWIKDLSEPDRFFILPNSIPILGSEINILPVIVAILMFLQQKITMVNSSATSAEQQKMMVILMPVIFGALFYRISSGLVLYWLINSLLMLIYQWKASRTNG